MSNRTNYSDPDNIACLKRVMHETMLVIELAARNAEYVPFPKQVQFYQQRHDIGDAQPANGNQTLFKKKASAFSANSDGMFAAPPKAEDHITKINLLRNMRANQFHSTVLIVTAATSTSYNSVPSNANTKLYAVPTELVPTEGEIMTSTYFSDNVVETDAEPVQRKETIPMHKSNTDNVYQMVVYRERFKPAS